MAKLFVLKHDSTARYYITEKEAKIAASEKGGEIAGEVSEIDVDEIDLRNWAASWRNWCEIRRETAKKREAKKSLSEKAEIAKKVWAKRRENGTDKRK